MNEPGDSAPPFAPSAGQGGPFRTLFRSGRAPVVLRTRPSDASPWLFDALRTDYRRLGRDAVPRTDQPVPESVLRHAREFLKALGTLPDPAVCRDADGGLVFEWVQSQVPPHSPARCLRVRIDADGMLVYAGRLGDRHRVNGAEPVGAEMPRLIREAIRMVVGQVA